MSTRKTFIVVGILLVTILLGVGYAIGNTTLTISGSAGATANDANFKVYLTGTPEVSDNSKVTASVTANDTATISVTGLTKVGDSASATYTIKNDSEDLSAALTASVIDSNDTYFTTTYEFDPTTLEAKGEAEVTVTVTLDKTPIADQTNDVTVTITAQPVEAEL